MLQNMKYVQICKQNITNYVVAMRKIINKESRRNDKMQCTGTGTWNICKLVNKIWHVKTCKLYDTLEIAKTVTSPVPAPVKWTSWSSCSDHTLTQYHTIVIELVLVRQEVNSQSFFVLFSSFCFSTFPFGFSRRRWSEDTGSIGPVEGSKSHVRVDGDDEEEVVKEKMAMSMRRTLVSLRRATCSSLKVPEQQNRLVCTENPKRPWRILLLFFRLALYIVSGLFSDRLADATNATLASAQLMSHDSQELLWQAVVALYGSSTCFWGSCLLN